MRITSYIISILMTMGLSTVSFAATDEYPEPPGPTPGEMQIRDKAGLGSQVPYATAGVIELGGSVSFVTANDFEQYSVSPSVGWFFADNFQISGIANLNSVNSGNTDVTYWTLLAEPSYHLPFNKRLFGFVGVGVGFARSEEAGNGTAVQPRIGANILIGRSGVLTPAFFTAFNTIDSVSVGGTEVLTVDQISGFNIGYTILW